ncbi:MAG: hypothetical protein AAFN93_20350 [Bacteroidota bacterium]
MIRVFFLTIFILSYSISLAQLNNRPFEQNISVNAADSNSLFLGVNMLGFSKNNEYFNDIADGFTLFGYQFNPYLSYQPLKNFRLDVGLYLQKDFGTNDFSEIAPTFSLKYQKEHYSILFGTLEGSINHNLIEPLYDFEDVLIDRLENGIQFLYKKDKLQLDAWVDWQNMIFRGDDDQEEVTGGLSANYTFVDKDYKLYTPVQFVVFHRGGQIDLNDDPLVTRVNTAIGLGFEKPLSENGFFTKFRTENYYVYYEDFSSQILLAFEDGNAWYLNASLEMKHGIEFMTSYWRGNEFISINGGQLYPSISSTVKRPDSVEEIRELLIFRIFHNIKIADNLYISSRFEPFYDLQNKEFEFSHGIYLNYRPRFFLLKAKDHR